MTSFFSFQRLQVWQEARQLTNEIYTLTKGFPPDERFGLISQIQRAAVSICCNLAEGSGRSTPPDQRRFYIIAKASLLEVMNLIILSRDFDFLSKEKATELCRKGKKLETNIQTLIRSR